MEKRLIIAVCALFFAMGSLFITQGMTGMYSWDRFDDYWQHLISAMFIRRILLFVLLRKNMVSVARLLIVML